MFEIKSVNRTSYSYNQVSWKRNMARKISTRGNEIEISKTKIAYETTAEGARQPMRVVILFVIVT